MALILATGLFHTYVCCQLEVVGAMQGGEVVAVVEGAAISGAQALEAEASGSNLTGPPGTIGFSSSSCLQLVPLLVSSIEALLSGRGGRTQGTQ